MRPDGPDLLVVVRHRPRRGFLRRGGLFRDVEGEVAEAIVEGVADALEVRDGAQGQTEVVMRFAAREQPPVVDSFSQSLVRQVAAVVGAQVDLPSDRLVETMLMAELGARQAAARRPGSVLRVAVERLRGGIQLAIGALENGNSPDPVIVRATPAGTQAGTA
jgi:hypothetical protein